MAFAPNDPAVLPGDGPVIHARVDRLFARRRRLAVLLPLLLLAYLGYLTQAFDLAGLAQRMRLDNAAILLSDSYSYRTAVTRDNRTGAVTVAIGGSRRGLYDPAREPGWVRRTGDTTTVQLPGNARAVIAPAGTEITLPRYGTITARLDATGHVAATFPPGPRPDWINASATRVAITAPEGRITITRAKTEVFRYSLGWQMFFFTVDSPYHGRSAGALLSAIVSGDRIDPARGTLAGIWHDFWQNGQWTHAKVAEALFETVLMAFLGTMGAALLALPLAFLSARGFTPLAGVRFALRRLFDLLRGVDGLIWTIILTRAFGLGPLTGALAILLTDTGSFGKTFSEALENLDRRQIEGIRATGANAVLRYRYGVLPQVVPVVSSQVLYFLESNTRSATVIGAIVGGGIGLLLTQAINTQQDWELVAYYILLILGMVMLMDALSGRLRRRLIRGAGAR